MVSVMKRAKVDEFPVDLLKMMVILDKPFITAMTQRAQRNQNTSYILGFLSGLCGNKGLGF
ncbi:MAG: hypothetical protein NPINA01_09080 [Nitrospinaceae bacterium]|nr:MAG: hypothetical protein NPINA01_09080 [Nitrospinaceae bacterium]